MKRYIAVRLLSAIPVMLVVAVVTFSLVRLAPGDPSLNVLGPTATRDEVLRLRKELGLDDPIATQFFRWAGQILRGDLGYSIAHGPVAEIIGNRWPPTVALAASATVVAVALAVPLGVLAAYKANSLLDRGIVVFASLGFAMPVFWQGFLAIWLFALVLGWLPVLGYARVGDEGVLSYVEHLILPVSVVAVNFMALVARMTRSTVLEVLSEDYVRTARAKGLRERAVLMRHALKVAFPPVLTVIGLGFGGLLTGTILVETLFSIPGIGSWVGVALRARDANVIQAVILLSALIYVVVNLVVDIAYAYLDPRIRYA